MKVNNLMSVLFILMVGTVFTTCKKDDTTEDPPWLADMKQSITNCNCEKSIIQATYQKQTIFYLAMTDPLCDGIQNYVLLDTDGKVVRTFSNSERNELFEVLTDKTVIYRCKKESK